MKEQLMCISPVDGRYDPKTKELAIFFSEYALISFRVNVEVEYFIKLAGTVPQLKEANDKDLFRKLREAYLEFTIDDAKRVKEIEKEINHDVKAVEYFVKEKLTEIGFGKHKEFVHFGLTSQDVNNTALPIMVRGAITSIFLPAVNKLDAALSSLMETCDIPMLAHTHGQPATPTKMAKELRVFQERLDNQVRVLLRIPHLAKFSGASGNLNAHYAAYPGIDWRRFADELLEDLGLEREQTTTQISHYDTLASQLDTLKRINTILIDLCRDMWTYISMGYFKQKAKEGEVGSSAMPHKVNPIDFENAEGNLGVANALLEFLSRDLPVSRLQRDLCDSTVTRNIGTPFAHTLIALKSLIKGLGKVEICREKIDRDLEANWPVISEAIQTILRRELYPEPYEALKGLTRGKEGLTKESFHEFVDTLGVSDQVKEEIKSITPWNYLGSA